MCLGVFFVQAASQFLLVPGATKADTVRRSGGFFVLSRFFLFGIARNFLKFGDFYYISVI